jgi:hypothetical protein
MAQGDIPVEGSAVGRNNTFTITAKAKPGQNPNDTVLVIDAPNRDLKISLNPGDGTPIINKTLKRDQWHLTIS